MKKILSYIEYWVYREWFNPFWTLYLNLRLCKFYDALKFPIYVWGGVSLCKGLGRITFPLGCRKGMIKIGRTPGHFYAPSRNTFLLLETNSVIKITGNVVIGNGVALRLAYGAILELHNGCVLGDNVDVMCEKRISIGENTIVTFESKIIDTNFHYILAVDEGIISRKNKDIIIGNSNWICNNTTIMKGTVTPDNCIVASCSLLNKDYGNKKDIVLAGIPAKVVRYNKKRIFKCDNPKVSEEELDSYFGDTMAGTFRYKE